MNETNNTLSLHPYDPECAYDLAEHVLCEHAMRETLDKLAGLVVGSKLPVTEQIKLFEQIGHIRGHVCHESRQMLANLKWRRN